MLGKVDGGGGASLCLGFGTPRLSCPYHDGLEVTNGWQDAELANGYTATLRRS